jgi:hypothetical protein
MRPSWLAAPTALPLRRLAAGPAGPTTPADTFDDQLHLVHRQRRRERVPILDHVGGLAGRGEIDGDRPALALPVRPLDQPQRFVLPCSAGALVGPLPKARMEILALPGRLRTPARRRVEDRVRSGGPSIKAQLFVSPHSISHPLANPDGESDVEEDECCGQQRQPCDPGRLEEKEDADGCEYQSQGHPDGASHRMRRTGVLWPSNPIRP